MKKGFTLLELLIVIAIIAILSVVLLPAITGAPAKARDAARVSTVESIVIAIEKVVLDGGAYPAATTDTCSINTGVADTTNANWDAIAKSLKSFPKPPTASDTLDSLCTDGSFYYKALTTTGNYIVAIQVERKEAANVEVNTPGSITALIDGNTAVALTDGSPPADSPYFYMVIK